MSGRRVAAWTGVGLGLLIVMLLLAVLVLTRTDWGRERVRTLAVDRLESMVHGELEIGRVEGNLLTRIRLVDVAIRDRQGRPFLAADTIQTRFGLRALLGQRIELSDLRVVRAMVVLDEPPGEEWNYVRIFEVEGDPGAPGTAGWGDWVDIQDLTFVDSRVTIRSEWEPPPGLTPAGRESAIRHALADDSRERVVEVPGGFQTVMDFRELDAALPRVVLAHPDSAAVPFEIERLSGMARPFATPAADIHHLSGEFRIVRDSLFMSGVRVELDRSDLSGGGVLALHSGELLLIARGDPLSFPDLRWLEPSLPERGGGSVTLRVDLGPVVDRIHLMDMDMTVGDASVEGRLLLVTGDTVRFGDTDLRFARVETEMLERFVDLDFPRQGQLTGRVALEGAPAGLRVDADVRFDDATGAASRVMAEGGLGVEPELGFRELRLEFSPLHADLARLVVGDLPLRGAIEGTAVLTGSLDILEVEADLALRDPGRGVSRVALAGGIDRRDAFELEDMMVEMDPLRLDLLRGEIAELPAGATATGRVVLDGSPGQALQIDGDLLLDDPATGVSGIGATGGIAFADGPRFDDLLLRLDPLRVDLIRPWIPDLPPGGALVGRVQLDGAPDRLIEVDGRLAHHHEELGISRFAARGAIAMAGPLEFHDLNLRLEPLNMALARAFVPDLPLDGTVTGTARLDGSPESMITVRGDLVHVEGSDRSHVTGHADIGTGADGRATVDVRLQPLSLAVAGRFIPGAGLHGAVSGRLAVNGDLEELRIDADLTAADGGEIQAVGRVDAAAEAPGYDLELQLRDFDLASVTWRAPATTDLTGTMTARGRGTDPGTMDATLAADLVGSGLDGVEADLVRLRASLGAGLARVDSSVVRLRGAEAVLDGSFGLVARREGVMSYRVAIDSLHAFAAWLPGAESGVPGGRRRGGGQTAGADTAAGTRVADRPAGDRPAGDPEAADRQGGDPTEAEDPSRETALFREFVAADGAHVTVSTTRVQESVEHDDEEAENRLSAAVEAEALEPDPPGAPAGVADARDVSGAGDTTAPSAPAAVAPDDSVAGSVRATGTLRGNVTRFDAEGRAEVDNLIYNGTHVGDGLLEYALADAGTESPDARMSAELREVRSGGVAFDSLSVRGRYHGVQGEGDGELVVAAHGREDTEYRADLDFTLSLDRSELRIAELMFRVDTVTWSTVSPGSVSWAGGAVDLAGIELASDEGGRVRLDGRLPSEGSGDLELALEGVELDQLGVLLQLDQEARGTLDLDARIRGSLTSPILAGSARLEEAALEGEDVPDVRASFAYENLELQAGATLLDGGRELAVTELTLPVELSFTPVPGVRRLPGELAVDLRADSLPVEAIPGLSEYIDDPRGRVQGNVAVRGTFDDPSITGAVGLDLGTVGIVPLGVRLVDVSGALRLDGDVLHVDSLVARSGGRIAVSGEIALTSLSDPTVALAVDAEETLVIDTEDATLEVDGELTVGGSLEALEVTGDVRTRSGVIYIPELSEMGETEVVSLHGSSRPQRIGAAFAEELRRFEQDRPILERLRLDIGLRIDRDVWLRSMEANVEIYTPDDVGPLRIRTDGEDGGLSLLGAINTDRGEYEFMSRRFDLTRGAVTFTGEAEIEPVLQIAAEHEVRLPGREAFDIRVLIGGTSADPEITLESNAQPPIAQTELLSYLAFGRDANSVLHREGSALSGPAGEAGELAGNVAGLATQQLGAVALDALTTGIERELMQDAGVDVFRITPANLPPDMFTGSYADLLRSTRVEAGKYVTSRLFVAGQLNTSVSRPGARVEYVGPYEIRWITSWESRWLPSEPTLTDRDPLRAGVLGSFLSREWRF